jgi:glucosamine kinase
MAQRFFLGVDGGGTKTTARIRDEAGNLLGEGAAGPGNARLGDAAYREIRAAYEQAMESAGLSAADAKRIHAGFGLAGTGQPADRENIRKRAYPFASLIVDTDAYAACLGAFRGGDGAILILGTGSAGLALINGRRVSVGGWGPDVSDDGSGAAIGRLAIRKALWALEGMAPRTPLADDILGEFQQEPANFVAWAAKATPGDFARFAPRVFQHAGEGDELARGILAQAATEATMLIDRLIALGAPSIAMIGSVFPLLLPWLPEKARARLVTPLSDAMDGAILMARRQLGAPVSDSAGAFQSR